MTHGEALALARKKKRAAEAKGRRLQYLARDYFVALGARVCVAWKLTYWVPTKDKKSRFPVQVRHDFYGLWDLIVCWPDGSRGFVQVTTLNNVAAKRAEITAADFPVTERDMIWGHEGGRTFRVLRGPAFETNPISRAQRRALVVLAPAREVLPGPKGRWTTDTKKQIGRETMEECARRGWINGITRLLTADGRRVLRETEQVEAPKRPKGGKRGRPSTKKVMVTA